MDAVHRSISYDEGYNLAKSFNMPFIETSALDGSNVDEAFTQLAHSLIFASPTEIAPHVHHVHPNTIEIVPSNIDTSSDCSC